MRKYSIFHPIIMSFFSMSLYRDVAKNWRGIGFLYLLLLQLLCWIPLVYLLSHEISNFIANSAPQWVNQVPHVSIVKGELSIDKPVPYYIRDPHTQEVVVIFDTAGKTTALDDTTATMLVTKDKIITKKDQSETRIYDLNKIDNMRFGPEHITALLDKASKYMPYIIYPLIVIFSVIYRLVQGMFYAIVGMLFNSMFKTGLSYGAIYRVTIIAMTPAIILSTILDFFGYTLQYEWMCYFIISMAFLAYGIYANAKPENNAIEKT